MWEPTVRLLLAVLRKLCVEDRAAKVAVLFAVFETAREAAYLAQQAFMTEGEFARG
jgi:hypothetical protein